VIKSEDELNSFKSAGGAAQYMMSKAIIGLNSQSASFNPAKPK